MYNIFDLFNVIVNDSLTGGFGINTDIFDTNVINIVIVWAILFYVGKDFLSSTLSARQEKIVIALNEAEEQLNSSKLRLKEAETKVSQTEASINQIKLDAEAAAQTLKESILLNGKKDIEFITLKGETSITNLERNVQVQIQETITKLALKRVVSNLKQSLNLENQTRYMDKAISQLGGVI